MATKKKCADLNTQEFYQLVKNETKTEEDET